ncbi:MAG TPA: transposase [Candidatus Deferrimicrobium sp.]|nr:transposase [Candidatus Deferrimicrobium sp.]
MSRNLRPIIPQEVGLYHLMSRVVGGAFLLGEVEKMYFLYWLELLSRVFYVHIYSYCIMENHFHILAGLNTMEAQNASKEELFARYEKLQGKGALPPEGSFKSNGEFIPDGDGGIERLRRRLGSISCFMQALKQGFSRWYNEMNNRTGYFWSDRFKSVILFRGEAELNCSAYIDLNPVRAHMVEYPENYKWSSFWLMEHEPERARSFLTLLPWLQNHLVANADNGEKKEDGVSDSNYSSVSPHSFLNSEKSCFNWYKGFVYASGGIKHRINQDQIGQIHEIETFASSLGVWNRLNTRIDYFSRGIAIGNEKEIEDYQRSLGRKHIGARKFLDASWAYATRVLKLKE